MTFSGSMADPVWPHARRMRAAAPQARFAVVAGAGHAPMLDEPEAVAAIDEFLAPFA